ncbi:MAG TPA: TetR/AcrR family transcriptional regulator [Streptosporangiaceae bacterium]|jgi:AcrR family transcriptional regulator
MTGTRDRILDAATHVMRTRGFARTTTKEIARAAGYSEATLYKHFQDKTDLFLAVLKERLPTVSWMLSPAAGQQAAPDDLAARLTAFARGAVEFYQASFPISASVFSEPDLLAAHHAAVTSQGAGPHMPVQALARYLRTQQEYGAVRAGADCDAAASLLLGSCFQYAFLRCFAQRPPDPEADAAHAAAIVTTLLAGLDPPNSAADGTEGADGSGASRTNT